MRKIMSKWVKKTYLFSQWLPKLFISLDLFLIFSCHNYKLKYSVEIRYLHAPKKTTSSPTPPLPDNKL